MYLKLQNIYNIKLADCIKNNKLQTQGYPMVWKTKQKNAYFFEAGIPVNKQPTKMGKGIYLKNTSYDSIFVAHFFGPNNLIDVAYDALKEKLTDLHKNKTSGMYEIYVGNHFSGSNESKDFYKLQTDVVLPYK